MAQPVRTLFPRKTPIILVGDTEFGPVAVITQLKNGAGITFYDKNQIHLSAQTGKTDGSPSRVIIKNPDRASGLDMVI
jgi:hypothetical protein